MGTTTTTTTTLPATIFSNNPILFDFLCSFVFGALFTGALGAAISCLVPRIFKDWDPFRGLQTGSPRTEPHVQRAVALAVVCMIVALILAWYPLFEAPSSPTEEDLNQETTRGPVALTSSVSTTLQPQVSVSDGCCSWDGGRCATTSYCTSAKSHCENHCAGKWKV